MAPKSTTICGGGAKSVLWRKIVANVMNMQVDTVEAVSYTHLDVYKRQDIAGVRVICPFISDVYQVANMLVNQADVEIVTIKDYIKKPKENGYRLSLIHI